MRGQAAGSRLAEVAGVTLGFDAPELLSVTYCLVAWTLGRLLCLRVRLECSAPAAAEGDLT